MIKEEILCAGYGGQGMMLMGKLLAYAGMNMGYNVTWIPSYGAEVRGGTAHSMVRIQKGKIANPALSKPTICIVMNKPSLAKFAKRVRSQGLLLIDISDIDIIPEIKNVTIRKASFTKIAQKMGNKKVANMLAIGALNRIKNLFPIDELVKSLPFIFKDKNDLIPLNEKALREGHNIKVE